VRAKSVWERASERASGSTRRSVQRVFVSFFQIEAPVVIRPFISSIQRFTASRASYLGGHSSSHVVLLFFPFVSSRLAPCRCGVVCVCFALGKQLSFSRTRQRMGGERVVSKKKQSVIVDRSTTTTIDDRRRRRRRRRPDLGLALRTSLTDART